MSTQISQKFKDIKRPTGVRFYNSFARSLGISVPWSDLSENRLIKSARQKTGLSDFGDDSFMIPFRKLLQSVNEEARLHPFGRVMLRIRFIDILSTRLKLEYFFNKYPEIEETRLSPITLITGLQRTGTTKLQRLLSKDRDNRTLKSWEVLCPVPYEKQQPGKPDKRIADARIKEKFVRYIDPEFYKIHAVMHDAPEEEILLLDNAFLSTTPEAMWHVPSYAAWLEAQDQVPAYRYLKKQLKLLQWQDERKRWILKTPHHLEFLPALTTVFPEIRIIQTHRDPIKTLGSMCSLVEHTRAMFSDKVDLYEIGRHWQRKTGLMVENGLAFRQTDHKIRFLDISYYDLIEDTMNEMKKIYGFMGVELQADTIKAMQKATKTNTKHKFGRHKYNLHDYNISAESANETYAKYRSFFNIQYE